MVEFTGMTTTSCGAPVQVKRAIRVGHVTVVCGIVGNKYTKVCLKILMQLQYTSQCDGFTKWASSIDVDCCHLESILSVWSKAINDGTSGHY